MREDLARIVYPVINQGLNLKERVEGGERPVLSDETTEWGSRWSNSKLETQKYGTNDREFKFWDQADLAARRSDRDALEVYYLCVMLGFRGRWLDRPQQLAEWRNAVEE